MKKKTKSIKARPSLGAVTGINLKVAKLSPKAGLPACIRKK